ncbi:MAG: tRNA 2-selenouridine(34) synthase MnmH [Bacillota bacterium]|nr:tRNA 2-selenouridine(34) synthase MnmH [Bacillota bacterium]
MYGEISFNETITLEDTVFIDIRSPHEFSQGSIPGSINIPLFSDEEREIIGILYKDDHQKARIKGLNFATKKLPDLIENIKNMSSQKTPVLYCWRGGMRSTSLYSLLEMMEIPGYKLKGGYKSFRRFILDQLDNYELKKPVFVLNGLTGVGKTEVLHILTEMDCPTIDLEGLACHRGSLFGHLGIKNLRKQKDFDALLWNRLEELKNADYLIVEGEGKRIGSIYQPEFLFRAITGETRILLTAPLENRVNRLLKEYTPSTPGEIKKVEEAILLLEKYLGKETINSFLMLLYQENYFELVSQLCRLYYDRLYSDSRPGKIKFEKFIDSSNSRKAAEEIREFMHKTLKDTDLAEVSPINIREE